MMQVVAWPFRLLWQIVSGLVGLTGRLLAVVLGLVLIVVGAILTMTVVGAVIGVPLMLIGLALVVRGLF